MVFTLTGKKYSSFYIEKGASGKQIDVPFHVMHGRNTISLDGSLVLLSPAMGRMCKYQRVMYWSVVCFALSSQVNEISRKKDCLAHTQQD